MKPLQTPNSLILETIDKFQKNLLQKRTAEYVEDSNNQVKEVRESIQDSNKKVTQVKKNSQQFAGETKMQRQNQKGN